MKFRLKKKLIISLITGLVGLSISMSSYADPISIGQTIYLYDDYGNGPGGVFSVKASPSGPELFETFCLEHNEVFSPGKAYTIGNISPYAFVGGPVSPDYIPGVGDPISKETAYLYYHFRLGDLNSLTNGTFVYGQASSADALQAAIWYLENETGGSNNDLVTLANENASPSDLTHVAVINLIEYGPNQTIINRQDQLTLVPEPTTLLLLGSGLIGLGLFRRYRRRAN